jgi:hypothetical protein
MGKKSLLLLVSLLTLKFILLFPLVAYSLYLEQPNTSKTQPEFSPTRLILKLKPEVDKGVSLQKVQGKVITGLAQLDSLNVKFKVERQEKLFREFKDALKSDKFSGVYILEVPKEIDLKKMKEEYEKKKEVEYAELDYQFELFEAPNDTLFLHQWYLNNTSQGYYGIKRTPGDYNDSLVIKYGTVDADIDALEVFEKNLEITVPLVGIIDTGIDLDHIDLVNNIWTNPGEIPDNGIDDDHNGFVDDFYGWDFSGDSASIQPIGDNNPTDYKGHGTHVAGIVAGVRNNGIGISGINTPCKIMAIKFFPNALSSLAAKSIIYAADWGCDVINMSWGNPYPSKLIEDALNYAISKGVLPVAAAGNSGREDYFFPASLPQVFTVGASNSKDEVTNFSTYGEHIEVVAPGEDILSLRADNTDMYAQSGASEKEPSVHIINDQYYLADGTSMAAPMVVGVASYLLAASPGISQERVKEIIEESTDDIIYPFGGDSLFSPGKDKYSGYGRVNLNSALKLLSGSLARIDYPYANAIVSGEIAILGTASGDSFQNYVLEYGVGFTPAIWTTIASSSVPVRKDTLGIWNSSGLTGLYSIRLTVGDQNQAVVQVIVKNSINIKITSPVQGDTIRGYAEIWGNTVLPHFSHYTLEYSVGASPDKWDTIITSTRMVADGILGRYICSPLGETDTFLRLTVKSNGGEVYTDSVGVMVKTIASSGWKQELFGYPSLSPGIGDTDGDGYDEIVVGTAISLGWIEIGVLTVFSHDGKLEPGWPEWIDTSMNSSPALGDLDGDGRDDIIICSGRGVYAYLSNSSDWFASASSKGNDQTLATPVIADLENDGYQEVMIVNQEGGVYGWRHNGQPIISGTNGIFAQAAKSTSISFPCIAVADLDRDGKNEVIVGAGGIYIWNTAGNLLLSPLDFPLKLGDIFGIAIANLDTSEDLEVIAFGNNESYATLCAFKKNGSLVAGYPIILQDLEKGQWLDNPPAVGDLDGDGILEIVVSVWTIGEARIYAWHQDGTPLGPIGSKGFLVSMKSPDIERKRELLSSWGNDLGEILARFNNMSKEKLNELVTALPDTVFASASETFGGPVLADVNGDGSVEIIVRAGNFLSSGYERVFAWDYEGNLVPGWPLYTSTEASMATNFPYTPILGDIDKDGKLNMLLANHQSTPKFFTWEFDTDYDTTFLPWPKYMHDKWNRGIYAPLNWEIINVAPSNFQVKGWNDTDSSVILAWVPKPRRMSEGYNLYRTITSGEPGERINVKLIPQPDSQYRDVDLIAGETYYYTITNVDKKLRESSPSLELKITLPAIPTSFALSQNYPNPFNFGTVIEYSIPRSSQVTITIYNILGQRVKTVLDQKETAGDKRVQWNGKNEKGEEVSSGIYFYRIETEEFAQSKKMLLLK